MFGDPLVAPKEPKVASKIHPTQDILNTSVTPYLYGHRARGLNTDYHIQLLHYNQQCEALDKQRASKEGITKGDNLRMIMFDAHALKKVVKSEVKARIKIKMDNHEASVNARREKLKELFATEEREFVQITVETCQRGVQDKLQAMKEKSRMLREKKAKENEEFVQQKRLQQYMIRCMDLIPAMNEKNLRESKIIQLQQMRENESRREAEREWNKMWAHLQEREAIAKAEREKQELIIRYNKDKKDRDILELQMEGKRLLKEEEKRIAIEDRIELQKLADKMKLEDKEAQEAAHKKRDQLCEDLLKQIDIQRSFINQNKKEDEALDEAFAKLCRLEHEKELNQQETSIELARKEALQYKQHMKELADLRQEEQRKLDELLSKYQCEINKKMDRVQCELQEARKRLMQQTLTERNEQLEYKKDLARKMLAMKETENEWLANIIKTNDGLLDETKRLSKMAAAQYRDDLNKQIDYNNLLKEREKIELERLLQKGKEEEVKYKALVENLIGLGHSAGSVSHPFRRILDQHDCHCLN